MLKVTQYVMIGKELQEFLKLWHTYNLQLDLSDLYCLSKHVTHTFNSCLFNDLKAVRILYTKYKINLNALYVLKLSLHHYSIILILILIKRENLDSEVCSELGNSQTKRIATRPHCPSHYLSIRDVNMYSFI